MKSYNFLHITNSLSKVNETMENFAKLVMEERKNGYEPMGTPSIALSNAGIIIALMMVREME